MLIMSLGCLQFSRESCLLYTFLLGYLPSIFCDFGEKPIDFYLQDSFRVYCIYIASNVHKRNGFPIWKPFLKDSFTSICQR